MNHQQWKELQVLRRLAAQATAANLALGDAPRLRMVALDVTSRVQATRRIYMSPGVAYGNTKSRLKFELGNIRLSSTPRDYGNTLKPTATGDTPMQHSYGVTYVRVGPMWRRRIYDEGFATVDAGKIMFVQSAEEYKTDRFNTHGVRVYKVSGLTGFNRRKDPEHIAGWVMTYKTADGVVTGFATTFSILETKFGNKLLDLAMDSIGETK